MDHHPLALLPLKIRVIMTLDKDLFLVGLVGWVQGVLVVVDAAADADDACVVGFVMLVGVLVFVSWAIHECFLSAGRLVCSSCFFVVSFAAVLLSLG